MADTEFADRLRALLERMAARLPSEELRQYREFDDVGEWDELIDNLAALLVKEQVPISCDERDEFAAILDMCTVPSDEFAYIKERGSLLASLNVR